MPSQDAKLAQRAKGGDEAAFAEIYNRHYEDIYTYLYYRVNDGEAAQDLAAEVFVRLVERIDSFTYRGRPILAWLYTIARNLLIDYQRQQSKALAIPLDEQLVAKGVGPAEAVDHGLTRDCLIRSLQHLTEDQQRVVIHKLLEGRSNAEVAELMNKTEGAIKSLQHRALASLRRAMRKERCYDTED
jgi:RNA polymerase sigma-70 factor (ECF subfamily)